MNQSLRQILLSTRYGAYYYETMANLESNYPGAESDMSNGLSVQAQNSYPIMTAADQRGEQTINRDAKTTGKCNSFNLFVDSGMEYFWLWFYIFLTLSDIY